MRRVCLCLLLIAAARAAEPPSLALAPVAAYGATRADEPMTVRLRLASATPWRGFARISFTGAGGGERCEAVALDAGREETVLVSRALSAGDCAVRAELVDGDGAVVAAAAIVDRMQRVDPLVDALDRDLALFESALTPFVWVATRGPRLALAHGAAARGLGAPTRLWAAGADGARMIEVGGALGGNELSEPWLLVGSSGAPGWDALVGSPYPIDAPLLIVLERRPTSVALTDDGVRIAWPGAGGRVAIAPLEGVSLVRAEETARWRDALPKPIVARCRRLAAFAHVLPLGAQEDYRVDAVRDVVQIRERVEPWTFADEWATPARAIAPLEPLIALAAREGCPFLTLDSDVVDLEYALGAGSLAGGARGTTTRYGLSGLLAVVDQPAQPARIASDEPLLADARGGLAKAAAALAADAPLDVVAPLAELAPYADTDTAARLAAAAERAIAAALAAPTADASAAARTLIALARLAPIAGGARIAERFPVVAALGRAALGAPRWGAAGLGGDAAVDDDARLGAAIALARLAWRAGDDRAWRRGAWWTAKLLTARWAALVAYPRRLVGDDRWAACAADARIAARDVGGEIRVVDARTGLAMPVEAPAWVRPAAANLGLLPGRAPFLGADAAEALPFALERVPDWLSLAIDELPRRRAPLWHRAAYVDPAALPALPAEVGALAELLAPAFGPTPPFALRAALKDLPASERRRLAQRFWQANGGVAGHEWEIILAGAAVERAPLWRDEAGVPTPDERYAHGFDGDDAAPAGSPVFAVDAPAAGWPTLGWLAPSAPKDGDGPPLPLCAIAPAPGTRSLGGAWRRVDAHLRVWSAAIAPAAPVDATLDALPDPLRAALYAADPAGAPAAAATLVAEAAVPWRVSPPLAATPLGAWPAVADDAWTTARAEGFALDAGDGGRRARRWLHLDAPAAALLAVGSARAVEVRIGGACVLRHLVRRELRCDDDRVAVALPAGWSVIDLWLPEGGACAARLCDERLRPLAGARWSGDAPP